MQERNTGWRPADPQPFGGGINKPPSRPPEIAHPPPDPCPEAAMNRSSAQAEEPMRQEGAGSSFPASDAFFAALLEALQDPNAARKDPDLDARMGQLYDEMDRETNAILERNRQRVRAYRMSEEQSSIEESPEITRLSEFRDGSTRQNMSIGMRGEILQAVNAVNIVVWSAVTSLNIAAGNERAALITTGITGASGIYAVLTIGRNR